MRIDYIQTCSALTSSPLFLYNSSRVNCSGILVIIRDYSVYCIYDYYYKLFLSHNSLNICHSNLSPSLAFSMSQSAIAALRSTKFLSYRVEHCHCVSLFSSVLATLGLLDDDDHEDPYRIYMSVSKLM